MDDLTLRRATPRDVRFLIEAVKAAEQVRAESGRCMYESIFEFSSDELAAFLQKTLVQEGSGHQLTYCSFFVMTRRDRQLACCAAWSEAHDGVASGFKVATAVAHHLGSKRWIQSRARIKAVAQCAPHRTAGALQMETFYVEPGSRGLGITGRLIDAVLRIFAKERHPPDLAEISLLCGNDNALRAYEKAGFSQCWSTETEIPLFQQLTGSAGFIQMCKVLSSGRLG